MTCTVPPLLRRLCDDAAIFPPGSAPLPRAVADHDRHHRSWYADLVGPLVVSAAVIDELAALVAGREHPLEVTVTVPSAALLPSVAARLSAIDAVRPMGLEVVLSEEEPVSQLAMAQPYSAQGFTVAVEIPRFLAAPPEVRRHQREALLDQLAGTGLTAKLRTGGVRAEDDPDDIELAHAIVAVVSRGVRFKATAGLHHLARAVDPATGLDQYGFGNVLLATDLGLRGTSVDEVAVTLAVRDEVEIATRLASLDEAAAIRIRAAFASFGTCSIVDPLADLTASGLLARPQENHR